MKKIYLIKLFAVLFTAQILAQPSFNWAKAVGDNGDGQGRAIVADASGNVYTVGSFQGINVDFDPGAGTYYMSSPSNSADGFFIQKLSSTGTFVWAKQLSGSIIISQGTGLALDAAGDVYMTGYFINTPDFDPGAGTFTIAAAGSTDAFVMKLTSAGNFVWAKAIGGTGGDGAASITVDASGNVLTSGYFSGTADMDPGPGTYTFNVASGTDMFISKLSFTGNFVWAAQIAGPSQEFGTSVKTDASGNVYTAGYFQSTPDFDPGAGTFTMTSAGNEDIFVSKLDASGNFVFAKRMGSGNTDIAYSMAIDAAGNILTTGYFFGTVDFDPNAGFANITSGGSGIVADVFISKLNSSGNYVWAKNFTGQTGKIAYGIATDPANNVYTTGYFYSTYATDFDPGPGTYTLQSQFLDDAFISKLDANGNFNYAGKIGGPSSVDEQGNAIYVDAAGSIYVTGYFGNTTDFDPNASTFNMTMTGGGAKDIFTLKLNGCTGVPATPAAIIGSTAVCSGSGASSYSVALIGGATSYSWSLPASWTGTSTTNSVSATPGSTGIFTVTANNACGASAQRTLNILVNASPVISVNSGVICIGQSFTMAPTGASTYTFSTGSAVISPTVSNSYSVVGTSTAGCVSLSPAVSIVSVNPLPTVSASTSSTLLCIGQTATLTAAGAGIYTWNPGGPGASISISPTITTNYTVTGTDSYGCQNSAVFTQSVSTCVGINQFSTINSELTVYPNPTNGSMIVKGKIGSPIQVYNLLGELILNSEIQSTETSLDLSQQTNGIYFIKVGTEIKKIIKE